MYSDAQRIKIAAALVQKERAESILEDQVPVRGITPNKLLEVATLVGQIYQARKKNQEKADFEQILEDAAKAKFTSEPARCVAKHILGHYFAWRRNKQLSAEAHVAAAELGFSFL